MIQLCAILVPMLAFSGQPTQPAPPPPPPPSPQPSPPPAPHLPAPAPPGETREQALERRLRELEARAAEPAVQAGEGGFLLRSSDGDFQLLLRGYLQADQRFYLETTPAAADAFLLRRARPSIEGTVYRWFGFKLMPDFGGGQVLIADAYLELRPRRDMVLTAGKFKPPIGFENLQAARYLTFVERGLPNNLVPSRELGAQLGGELWDGVLRYAVAIVNGVADGGLSDGDNSDDKDVAGRVFLHPFRPLHIDALRDFGVGFSASFGKQTGSPAAPNLPSYRTLSKLTFFTFLNDGTPAGTVVAAGDRTRLSPHGYFYFGRFGLFGEYVREVQRVEKEAVAADLEFFAWQGAASCVLFGGRTSWEGVRAVELDPAHRRFGALEIAARYGEQHDDPTAFALGLADPGQSAEVIRAAGGAVNWYVGRGFKLNLDFEFAQFVGGGTPNRGQEKTLLVRTQVGY